MERRAEFSRYPGCRCDDDGAKKRMMLWSTCTLRLEILDQNAVDLGGILTEHNYLKEW